MKIPGRPRSLPLSLSKIYRYVLLKQKDKELVNVEDEIEFAKTYCEL